MTSNEFENEFKRLKAEFPQAYASIHRRDLISRIVGPLPAKWWAGVVDHIILTNNPRFDIDAAARSERNAIRGMQATKEVSQAVENFGRNMTDAGLENTLKQFKAKSLWDAIENSKKGKGA